MAQMASKQQIKASKYHMRALGTADPNSNTLNIILNYNDLPAVQWPKWQIFTRPNGPATNTTIIICQPYNGPNGNQILTYPP